MSKSLFKSFLIIYRLAMITISAIFLGLCIGNIPTLAMVLIIALYLGLMYIGMFTRVFSICGIISLHKCGEGDYLAELETTNKQIDELQNGEVVAFKIKKEV